MASYSFALFALLVEPGRPMTLVSSDFESHNARLDSWVDDIRTYGVMADPVEAIAELLRSDAVLEPGMTFHASMSLRLIGEFGVTVGDTVAVTDTGCEVLTSGPRELHVVAAH